MFQKKYLVLVLLLALCSTVVSAQEQVNLLFTYWGSGQEKDVIEQATAQYMVDNPNR